VLAELTHLVAWGNNSVAASQKLVWAVQRMQRLPQELATEGALAALRLITEVSLQCVCWVRVCLQSGCFSAAAAAGAGYRRSTGSDCGLITEVCL
jgi:hypothetical protein